MSNIVNLFWKEKKTFANEKNIIYQIYGDHLIYGKNVLLYIGETIDYNRRKIEQDRWVDFEQNNTTFYAEVKGDEYTLKKVETLLIFSHSPSYNSKKLCWNDEYKEDKMIVRNYGLKGVLLPEISFEYWSCFYNYGGWSKNAEYKNNK